MMYPERHLTGKLKDNDDGLKGCRLIAQTEERPRASHAFLLVNVPNSFRLPTIPTDKREELSRPVLWGVELFRRRVQHQLPVIAVTGYGFTAYMLSSLHEQIGFDKRQAVWCRNVAWKVASCS